MFDLLTDRICGWGFAAFNPAFLASAQDLLNPAQFGAGLFQIGLDALELSDQQVFIIGDQHRALLVEDFPLGPAGQTVLEPFSGQRLELATWNLQQVGMVGRD